MTPNSMSHTFYLSSACVCVCVFGSFLYNAFLPRSRVLRRSDLLSQIIGSYTDEHSQAHGAQSSLTVTHPSINLGRRCLTSMNMPIVATAVAYQCSAKANTFTNHRPTQENCNVTHTYSKCKSLKSRK